MIKGDVGLHLFFNFTTMKGCCFLPFSQAFVTQRKRFFSLTFSFKHRKTQTIFIGGKSAVFPREWLSGISFAPRVKVSQALRAGGEREI
jgi:hypothetical protein